MEHPPYSPDLAQSEFWSFNHLKKHLRGWKFNSKEDLKSEVNNLFRKGTIHSSKLDLKPWWIAGESMWLSMGITLKNDTYIHCLFQIQNLVDLPFLFLYESNYL